MDAVSDTAPGVSVVIPTRNRARYVRATIGIALAQQGVDVEVVVVDDASEDETPQLLGELADERVRVVRRERRGHTAGARNAGIAAADREWIAFLDDDDVWAPHKLQSQIAAARAGDAAFAYGGAVAVDDMLRPLYVWRVPDPATLLQELLALNVMPAGASNVVARADLLDRVGPLDGRLSHTSDWDLWIRLAAEAKSARVDEVLTAYRLHAHGQHGDLGSEVLDELQVLEEKHRDLHHRFGVALDRVSMESYVERRARQVEARLADARRPLPRRLARRVARFLRAKPAPTGPEAPAWLKAAARDARREPQAGASPRRRATRSAPTQP
jgi:glycosyltransferase involved in cell wall biosynthesis